MRYHVVLCGPRSDEPGAARALAGAIAARYSVPTEAIAERLAVGGFRVKSDVDLDTAMSYAVDLTKLGGACVILDAATGKPVERATPGPSGMGALDSGDLVVATLDGEVDDGDEVLALDSSPYEPKELATPIQPDAAFAPPPTEIAAEELMLADDPRELRAAAQAAAPARPIVLPEPSALATTAAPRPRGPGLGERAAKLGSEARASLARRGRLHVVAGALLAVLLGFAAAHVAGVIQESSAYPPIRAELGAAYAAATDPESHAALPQIREGMQELVDARQRRIAITSGLVWIAAGIGFGFLWFRKIRWERLVAAV